MISQILKDLEGVIRVRNIDDGILSRKKKLEEEAEELHGALLSGKIDRISAEGADVCFVAMITMIQQGINPFAAMAYKLDRMNEETPWREK